MSDYRHQVRHPVSPDTCSGCAALLRQLGDRDAQLREWMKRAQASERATSDLAEVVAILDQVGAPTSNGKPHQRLTVAGRVKSVIQ